MEYYGGYVKVHTTKRHGIQEGDTVILGGIKAAGWSDLNGSPFLVEKTTKTTITLENSTAVINMGNAVDGSVEGGALIRIYVAMITIDTVDTKETVRIGGHGLEVSGGTIDLTGAHAGTTLNNNILKIFSYT